MFELADLWPAAIVSVGAMRRPLPLRLLEKLELYLYRRAAAIVALSAGFKENLVARGIPAEKIAVVMNGADLTRYGPRPRDEALAQAWGLGGRFVVGYVGTLGMAHALRNVLDAAERLRDEPDITFLIVGPGAERDMLIADARRRRLGNVVFQPMQPKEKLSSVWSLCDIALAHFRDGPLFSIMLPMKMFEAMGMGLPILLAAPEGEASRRRDLRQGPRQVGVSVPCARQAREHDRFLSLGDPQHQGREAIPRQGPERVEGLGVAGGTEHRQGADVRCRHRGAQGRGKCPKDTRHRQVKYLNNVVEADHGKLKLLIRPVRGFKTLKTAYATIKGFEVMRALRKGQAGMFALQDGIVGEARIVERAFGLGPCALTEVMALLQDRLANAEA